MAGDDDDPWFRQPWMDEPDETGFAPPSPLPKVRSGQAANADSAALLYPLANASAALARLDARLEASTPAVAEGLRARLALREAAGWLAHQYGAWVHPTDLGLRAAFMTGPIAVAALSDRLRTALPSTLGEGPPPEVLAEDLAVGQALHLAQLWKRLAEQRSWTPLADAAALRPLLAQLGGGEPSEAALADWLGRYAEGQPAGAPAVPALLRAAQAAQAWPAQDGGPEWADRLNTAALVLAACTWKQAGSTPSLALPVWSAAPGRLGFLGLTAGPAWLPGFLDAVADAAQRAGQELFRLQAAAERAAALRRTARSQLPDAAALALRLPVLTARGLADRLRISPVARQLGWPVRDTSGCWR